MKKSIVKKSLVMLVLLGMFFVSACGEVNEILDEAEELEEQQLEEPAVSDGSVVVTDQMGREVVIQETPQRIISLSPSNTEVAFALGLEDAIVGVTEYCNYPPEAQEKDIVGGFSTPSIEKIIELEPELILASTIHEEEVPRLEELGIPVLVVESSTLDELYISMLLVAEVTGVLANGEALVASMQERIEAVDSVVGSIEPEDRVRVYYEVYSDPLMSAGTGAFVNDIITLAGGINIFGDVDENYPQVSAEYVADKQPEIILFPDYHGTADLVLEGMADRPGWESVPAVINNRIHAASDDTFARPGPRAVEAIEEAARVFYPGLF